MNKRDRAILLESIYNILDQLSCDYLENVTGKADAARKILSLFEEKWSVKGK